MSSRLLKNNHRFYKNYIATNKLIIQEPIIQEPIIQEPIIQEPIIQEPIMQEPTMQEPTMQEPIIQEPIIQKPIIQKPIIQEPLNDELSVISDITGNSDTLIEDLQQFRATQLTNVNIELNKLTSDTLKEKCKEYKLGPLSKLKKNELIELLINAFTKLYDTLTNKTANELKNMCKMLEIKGAHKHKKDGLFMLVLTHCSTNLIFKVDDTPSIFEETKDNCVKAKVENKKLNLEKERLRLEELEKERLRLEELEKERLRLEELEKEKIIKKDEIKRKKQAIPKQIRNIVWNHYIGEDIIKHKCLSCKKVTISNINFEVGHVISEKHGGTHEINNLRPICGACNHSMGTENMVDFVVKYGLYIG